MARPRSASRSLRRSSPTGRSAASASRRALRTRRSAVCLERAPYEAPPARGSPQAGPTHARVSPRTRARARGGLRVRRATVAGGAPRGGAARLARIRSGEGEGAGTAAACRARRFDAAVPACARQARRAAADPRRLPRGPRFACIACGLPRRVRCPAGLRLVRTGIQTAPPPFRCRHMGRALRRRPPATDCCGRNGPNRARTTCGSDAYGPLKSGRRLARAGAGAGRAGVLCGPIRADARQHACARSRAIARADGPTLAGLRRGASCAAAHLRGVLSQAERPPSASRGLRCAEAHETGLSCRPIQWLPRIEPPASQQAQLDRQAGRPRRQAQAAHRSRVHNTPQSVDVRANSREHACRSLADS